MVDSVTVEERDFAEEEVAHEIAFDDGRHAGSRNVDHGDAGGCLVDGVAGDDDVVAARNEDAA